MANALDLTVAGGATEPPPPPGFVPYTPEPAGALPDAAKSFLNTTAVGRIMSRIGAGLYQPFEGRDLGLPAEAVQGLRKFGTLPDEQRKVGPITHAIQTFNEAMILPAAKDLDAVFRGGILSPLTGTAAAVGAIAEETGLASALGYYQYERPGGQADEVATDVLGAMDALGTVMGAHLELPTSLLMVRRRNIAEMEGKTEKEIPPAAGAKPPDDRGPLGGAAPIMPVPLPDEPVLPPGEPPILKNPEPAETPSKANLDLNSGKTHEDEMQALFDEAAKRAAPMEEAPTGNLPMRPTEPPPLPKYAGSINLERLNSTDDVKQMIVEIAKNNGDFAEARRGKMTFEDIQSLADASGLDAAALAKLKVGQTTNAEEALAYRQAFEKSATNVTELARKARGGDDEAVAAFLQAMEQHTLLQARLSGLKTELGRAMSALRIRVGEDRAAALADVIGEHGGRDNVQDMIDAVTSLNSNEQVSKFIANTKKPGMTNKIIEAWMSALLSSPKTHIANLIGNTMALVNSVPETALAAAFSAVNGSKDRVYFGEAGARAFAVIQGSYDGLLAARRAFAEESEGISKVDTKFPHAIGGKTGKVIRIPLRFLGAGDAFFKAIAHRQELLAQAYAQAAKDGLGGTERATRMAELMDEPTQKMLDAAAKNELYQTFNQPLGPTGKAVQEFFSSHPVLKFIAPFIRTPVNLTKYNAGERTPFGLFSKHIRETMDGKYGERARDTQMARMALGTAIMTTAFGLAAQGLLTGGGPRDPDQRNTLYQTGWQPYSVKIGDSYYSYARMEPYATLLGLAADANEVNNAIDTDTAADIGALMLMSLGQNVTNKVWLQGPADLAQAARDPVRYGEPWVAGITSSFVPTVVADTARAQDPFLRQARTIIDSVKARVPGLSQTLMPKRDLWGEPIMRAQPAGPALVSPIAKSTLNDDFISREMLRLGAWKPPVDRSVRGVPLNDQQYDDLARVSGHLTRFALSQVVGSPGWSKMSSYEQKEVIDRTFDRTRESARHWMILHDRSIMQAIIADKVRQITGQKIKPAMVVPGLPAEPPAPEGFVPVQ